MALLEVCVVFRTFWAWKGEFFSPPLSERRERDFLRGPEGSSVYVTWPLDGNSQTCKRVSSQNPAASLSPVLLPAGGRVGGRVLRGEAENQHIGEHLWHLSWEKGQVCSSVRAAEEDEEAVRVEKAAPAVRAHPLAEPETQAPGLRFLCGKEVPAW